ncbi:MAG: amidohydrolase [Synergistaceae bacterium]|jgi:amidohydrolase|nr:amidohydrolase [Synergistaceae bacterium]
MFSQCDSYYERIVAHRRYLHEHPEVSYKEFETQKYIISTLEEIGVPYKTFEGNCAVLAIVKGHAPGKTLAFRADIDALAITEENTFSYRSKNEGAMHACGHDGHTAVLLAFGELLNKNKDKFGGEVRLIFQHAEEVGPGGAVELIKAGVLDGVDIIYGAHTNVVVLDAGQAGYVEGPPYAAADKFELEFVGKGGPANRPHLTEDPILAASHAVVSLQSIVARNIDPLESAVVSVCVFNSGSLTNVFPTSAKLRGTIRTFDENIRQFIKKRVGEVAKASSDMHGTELRYTHLQGYPVLVNNADVVRQVKEKAQENGIEMVKMEKSLGAEDFAYYAQKVPAGYFFMGCKTENQMPEHSPKHDIDERGLLTGLKLFVSCLQCHCK